VPARRWIARRAARDAGALLVHCGRLSPEKHVERAVDALAELHESG
jgi:alpha-1,6-mannosyltransferase